MQRFHLAIVEKRMPWSCRKAVWPLARHSTWAKRSIALIRHGSSCERRPRHHPPNQL